MITTVQNVPRPRQILDTSIGITKEGGTSNLLVKTDMFGWKTKRKLKMNQKQPNQEQQHVEVTNGGVGFFGFLTLLFIGLKLTGYVDWSWWIVLSPIWVPLLLVLSLFGVMMMMIKK